MAEYRQFKLSDGDWVCGIESDESTSDELYIENARSIEMVAMEKPGQFGVMFIPYTPTDPEIVTCFYRRHIISDVKGSDSILAEEYAMHIENCDEITESLKVERPSNILSIVPNKETTDDPV